MARDWPAPRQALRVFARPYCVVPAAVGSWSTPVATGVDGSSVLEILNLSTAATIWVAFGRPAVVDDTIEILPKARWVPGPDDVLSGQASCIATNAGVPIMVVV